MSGSSTDRMAALRGCWHPVTYGAELGAAPRAAELLGQLRDEGAGAAGAVAPAVIGAHQLVALHAAERERGAAVHAQVVERVRGAA